MTKVGFVSLGCPKNLVDSEVMIGILAREGYELTARADEAEVLVVNTCSFIEAAQKRVRGRHSGNGGAQEIRRGKETDCSGLPGGAVSRADSGAGAGKWTPVVRHRRSRTHHGTAVEGDLRVLPAPAARVSLSRLDAAHRHHAETRVVHQNRGGVRSSLHVCIIPQLRGAFRSRRFESVVREAENLARAGAREITLIGQDTTSYGEDLGLRDGLAQLLGKLAQTDDLLWVRFLYAYPNRVTQKLLDTIAAHPRLAKYMDMPLQHASRNVLARMKRGSNGDAFLKLLERMRTTIPGVFVAVLRLLSAFRARRKPISRNFAIS